MASVNKVILVGNCGRDPEIRYMPNGKASCNISVATSSSYKNQAGEKVENTEWHRVQFFDKLAEICGEYVRKGKPIYVEGRLKYGKYTDQAGVEKATCDIVATELQLLGARDQQQGQQSAPQQQRQAPAQQQQGGYRASAPRQAPAPRPAMPPAASSGFDDMDDDIPFMNPLHGAARCLAM